VALTQAAELEQEQGMTVILGIDHPLVAVRDLPRAIETYRSLGFFIAPPGQHPWGTSTALALFHHQILEIVSIGDAALLNGYEAGGFRFGRHVEAYLDRSEGVGLTALFTEDAEAVEAELFSRGVPCTGTINFGRDVVKADGQPDRTKTTLKIFRNDVMPRLSFFACQQHRRDLLEFPDRMVHPNGAHGFEAVTIVTDDTNKGAVLAWLLNVHGSRVRTDHLGHVIVPTTNGHWRVVSAAQFQSLCGIELAPEFLADGPRIAALDVRVWDLGYFEKAASDPDCALCKIGAATVAGDMAKLGGIALRFVETANTEGRGS
jgi:catechol 2,3-dioxygenase-like lactoylglutathione lyase family enzyme